MTKKNVTGETIHDQMLGKLALNYKMISHDQYIRVLRILNQENDTGTEPSLQEVLVKHNFISSDDIKFLYAAKDIITEKRKEKRFGAIAVRKGLLTKAEVKKAIEAQKTTRKQIGHILKDLNLLTEEQCDDIVDTQKTIIINLPAYDEVAISISDLIVEDDMAEIQPLAINISEDELVAVVVLENGNITPDLDTIKAIAADSSICFGIIDDDVIKENLRYLNLGLNSFVIAKGKESKTGIAGELILHFQPREKLAGQLDEAGNMDFKSRGEIPVTSEGELLAERSQMTGSVPGKTLFGKVIEVAEVEEADFISGIGTEMNRAGDKIFAACDGEPFLNLDGTVSVLSEVVVDNVDYETGNIDFDGNIVVRGKVSADFQVKGKSLEACEILEADINIEGDIEVEQGIIGARIRATGSVTATYIKNCSIICGGDIIAEKEVVDSDVFSGGNCIVRGNIISSKVCSGQSIVGVAIGSDRSTPNHLEIGMSEAVAAQITGPLDKIVSQQAGDIAVLMEKHDNMMNLLAVIKSVVKEISNDKTKNEVELESVKTLVSRMEKKSKRTMESGRKRIEEFENKINSAEEVAKTLYLDRSNYEKILLELNHEIKAHKEEHEKTLRKLKNLRDKIKPDEKQPIVRALETIHSGTKIVSPNTSIILKDNFPPVKIKEIQKRNGGNGRDPVYHLEITRA